MNYALGTAVVCVGVWTTPKTGMSLAAYVRGCLKKRLLCSEPGLVG